jgi:hypothetical protein
VRAAPDGGAQVAQQRLRRVLVIAGEEGDQAQADPVAAGTSAADGGS